MAETSAPFLLVESLKIHRGNRLVVDVPRLELARGQTLAVAGPNGAGKSTFLLALAHLLPVTSGIIRLAGEDTRKDTTRTRQHCALVLQEPLLLRAPVAENVAIGLAFRGIYKGEKEKIAARWMDIFGIRHLAARDASRLSGGEAQRVSLARAFATSPDLLLLDEPFSSLDAPTRASLLDDLQSILRESGQTAVFITHNLDEALVLGDQLAVFMDGQLRQVDEPRAVLNNPADTAVAEFVGVENVLPGTITASMNGLVEIDSPAGSLEAVSTLVAGRTVYYCVRPEDITLFSGETPRGSSARNQLACTVSRVLPSGPLARVEMRADGLRLVSLITRHSAAEMGLHAGMRVTACFKASTAHLLPR
jgi:tungstate transport system ATP-binding protein